MSSPRPRTLSRRAYSVSGNASAAFFVQSSRAPIPCVLVLRSGDWTKAPPLVMCTVVIEMELDREVYPWSTSSIGFQLLSTDMHGFSIASYQQTYLQQLCVMSWVLRSRLTSCSNIQCPWNWDAKQCRRRSIGQFFPSVEQVRLVWFYSDFGTVRYGTLRYCSASERMPELKP